MNGNHASLTDFETLLAQARARTERGSDTIGCKADRETMLRLLNEALASKLACVFRYRQHMYMARELEAQGIARELMQHALGELEHADRLAERIASLGGTPNLVPDTPGGSSRPEHVKGGGLLELLDEDLVAQRSAIDSYTEMIRCLGEDDPTTRRMLEDILAVEEEHAEYLVGLLESRRAG